MTGSERGYNIGLLDYRDIAHPEAGGAEHYLHEVFRRLALRGHRVRLLASSFRGAPVRERIDGIEVERRGNRMTFNLVALAACRRWSRRREADVVVENLCKIPFFTPRLGGGTPALTIVHHLFGNTVFQETHPLAGAYVLAYERFLPAAYHGTHIVAVSESTREDLLARGVRAAVIDVVPNGVDIARFRPAAGIGPGPSPRLVYLGRLKRYKRIDLLLRAASILRREWPDLEVEIIGRGDHLPELRRLSEELGLGQALRFTGFVGEEEKVDRLRRAHVVVYPSPKEGWGIAAVEASGCGVPVVASDSPGLREAVRHGETGLLVPHGDVEAMAAALRRLLRDEPLRRRLGAGGAAWAARFSWDAAADQIERNLEAVIAAARNRQ
jgi:glycosyltransferase involved in cell wall biosynthesis